MMHPDKEAARQFWNANPCGAGPQDRPDYATLAFFDEVRDRRYRGEDPWIEDCIPFDQTQGQRVLELGFGLGTDLMRFRQAGAEVAGVDLTDEHVRLAHLNFELHHETADLRLGDAAKLDFPADTFDWVYSLGVLHHTPDLTACLDEAWRVLKPGGTLILGLYYTFSAFHLVSTLFYRGLLKGELFRLGHRGLMATVEKGADGRNHCPLVKTYSKGELCRLLKRFSHVHFHIAHLAPSHFPHGERWVSPTWAKRLAPLFGWYVVAFARK